MIKVPTILRLRFLILSRALWFPSPTLISTVDPPYHTLVPTWELLARACERRNFQLQPPVSTTSIPSTMTTSGVQSAVAQAGAADDNVKLQKSLDKMAGDWNNLPEGHKLKKFHAELGEILSSTGYNEMYGVELQPPAEG